MATYYTPIPYGDIADDDTFNGPLGELDLALVNANAAIVDAQADATAAGAAATAAGAAAAAAQSTGTTALGIATTVAAEVGAARGGYSDLDARLDAIAIAGSGVSTLTSGATSAGQKVINVDSTTGILVNALISYTLTDGAVETNTVDVVNSSTQITCVTNVGTGGIADNTYLSMIPVGILMSSGAVVGAQQQMQEFEDGIRVSSTSGSAAKWAIKPTYVTFSGVRDEVFWCGWNVNGNSGARIDDTEASLYHAIEADYYEVGSGKHFSEWYIEFYTASGAIHRRPFSTSIDRANGDTLNQFSGQQIFYKSDGTLAWQIDTGGNLTSANIIRFTQNDGSVLTQLNAAATAYISLIRLNENDRVVLGDTVSGVLMALSAAANVGIGADTPDVKLHVAQRDSGTNGVVGMLSITRNSLGSVAAGFGSRLLFELQDSGADDTPAARIDVSWHNATNGAVEGDLALIAYDVGAREGLRIRGNGSAPAIGFLGAEPVERPAGVAVSAAGIHAALVSLGLIAA